MAKTMTHKIIESHLMEGRWQPGEEIGIKVDQTLTQDATGTMAYLQFEALNIDRVRTELSVSYVDHNMLQLGFENADDHNYLEDVAKRYGIVYSRPGNGICHQVHLERFSIPGKVLLGSDSHTPTCGGVGMLAIGAGGLDVALAMAGQPFFLRCPQVVRIGLRGSLKPWVAAKDVILAVLAHFGTSGNAGKVFEYAGPGVEQLSVTQRATITNMGAECGVTTSVFPSDALTHRFLEAQGRAQSWTAFDADAHADYAENFELDLSALEPMAAVPHSPGNVTAVRKLKDIEVNQVCIGTCTNSSYADIATTALMLRAQKPAPQVSLVITPGSRQILLNATKDGFLDDLLAAGARIQEPSCSFCIGAGMSPASSTASVRTSNRNFEGRSGTQDARVYLVSCETAVATAIKGRITDPRDLGIEPIEVKLPQKFHIDESMCVPPLPLSQSRAVTIRRGPNIGLPPGTSAFPDSVHGLVTIKLGDKITTDHIMPAGPRMKLRSNIKAYSRYVFEHVDPDFPQRAMAFRESGGANIIVAGESYGQGSSREHAAICPAYLGVRFVIAKSIERIHAANLVNFGILPLTFCNPNDYDLLDQGSLVEAESLRTSIHNGSETITIKLARGSITLGCILSQRQRTILLAGGALASVEISEHTSV